MTTINNIRFGDRVVNLGFNICMDEKKLKEREQLDIALDVIEILAERIRELEGKNG